MLRKDLDRVDEYPRQEKETEEHPFANGGDDPRVPYLGAWSAASQWRNRPMSRAGYVAVFFMGFERDEKGRTD